MPGAPNLITGSLAFHGYMFYRDAMMFADIAHHLHTLCLTPLYRFIIFPDDRERYRSPFHGGRRTLSGIHRRKG